MSIGRLGSSQLLSQANFFLAGNEKRLADYQERVSLGKNINRPSDDPLGTTRLLDLSNTIDNDQVYLRNISAGLAQLKTTDNSLTSLTNVVQRASELATQGASVSVSAVNAAALSKEVNQLIEQTVQLGNTRLGDIYIFGGLKSNSPPFARTTDSVAFTGTLSTESFQRNIEISDNAQVQLNQAGDSVFGTVTSSGGPPEVVSAGSGLLHTLMLLKQGLDLNDKTAIRNQLDSLETNLNNVTSLQAQNASSINRLELTKNRLDSRSALLSQQYADLQDVNMPKLITDLNFQQSVYQASLGVLGKIGNLSLLNYL
jgi:flagellar hook-associated protein 3 FlgL